MRPLWSEMLANTSRGMGSISSRKRNKDKPRSRASTVLLFTFIIVMFSFYSVMIGIGLTKALMVVGAEDLFIRIIAMATPIFTLVIGVLQAIPILYHESSLESLLVLPVKPSTITAAKLTQTFVPIFLLTTLLCYPSLIAHGIVSHRPWGYYVQSIPFMLYVTVAPFALTMILVLVMMRYTKLA